MLLSTCNFKHASMELYGCMCVSNFKSGRHGTCIKVSQSAFVCMHAHSLELTCLPFCILVQIRMHVSLRISFHVQAEPKEASASRL